MSTSPALPRLLAAVGAVALVAVGLAGCQRLLSFGRGPEPLAGSLTLAVEVADGTTRTAHLHLPDPLPSGPVPLVVALHGGTGSGAQFQRSSGFDALADAEGFAVVYPDGRGRGRDHDRLRTWNGGVCCGRSAADGTDDVAFLRRVVAEASQRLPVDEARVYATGHSNGMIMAYRLACEAADLFVAVAGQAGTLGTEGCEPTEPVSVLHLHGDADTNLPIDGGTGSGISRVDFPSPRQGIATVADAMGCDAEPVSTSSGAVSTDRWPGCDGTASIDFVTVAGASHGWMGASRSSRPGGPQPYPDLDATQVIWEFLASHPRTG